MHASKNSMWREILKNLTFWNGTKQALNLGSLYVNECSSGRRGPHVMSSDLSLSLPGTGQQHKAKACQLWFSPVEVLVDRRMRRGCLGDWDPHALLSNGIEPLFSSNSKFLKSAIILSHRILRYLHGVLNVDEKKTNYTVWLEIMRQTFWA